MADGRAARGFPAGLTLATAVALAILVGLGVWQLRRLTWKEGVLAHVAALQTAPARPLDEVLRRGGDLDFVRVSFDCPGLLDRPRVRLYALNDGAITYRLMTACPVGPARAASVLVDIGYEDCATAQPPAPASGPLVGILRTPDPRTFVTPPSRPDARLWYWRDLAGMAGALGAARPLPVFVALERGPQPAAGCRLARVAIPPNIPNRHLEYALTWFGLAAALAGVYAAMLFKRRKT
jgi:surfeit locus 1 family protein